MDSFVWQREMQNWRAFWLRAQLPPALAVGRPQVPYWDPEKDVPKARSPPIRGSTFWGSESVQRKNAWTDGVLCSSSNCLRNFLQSQLQETGQTTSQEGSASWWCQNHYPHGTDFRGKDARLKEPWRAAWCGRPFYVLLLLVNE